MPKKRPCHPTITSPVLIRGFDAWQVNYISYAVDQAKILGLSDADVEALENLRQVGWQKDYGELAEARAISQLSDHRQG